jgi:serine/threonine kinase 16
MLNEQNILIDSQNNVLLTDFGSVRAANLRIENRKDSVRVSEEAAEFCTISYRAPELFDPKTGMNFDTRYF